MTGWDAYRILNYLKDDLLKLEQAHGLTPDLLLVTGDLAFGHLGEGARSIQAQFEEVALFLEKVRNLYSRPIPAERVFIVPGNHDVVRGEVLASQTQYLDGLAAGDYATSTQQVNQLLRDAGGEWRIILQRLAAYREFLREHYPHLLQDPERLCYAHRVEMDGLTLGIAGLNSAWSCGPDEKKGNLWLGGQWQLRTLAKQLQGCDITLALAHHPLSWLVPQENPALDPELQESFDLFLHGHEHQAWVEEKPRHIRIAAGACYGETPQESGYNLVRLDPAQGKGEVWLRRFSDEGIGCIPRVVPGRTNNDGLWPLDLAWVGPTEAEAVSPASEPPAPSSAEGRGVYGRDGEIAALARKLHEKPILLIYGVSGVGKSKLVREVCRALPDSPTTVPITADPNTDAEQLFRQLAPVLGCHDQDPKLPRDLLKRIDTEALKQYRDADPCVVHIHRANELFTEHGFRDIEVGTLLRLLAEKLPQWRIVLESIKHPPQRLFTDDRLCHEARVRGLDTAALQRYFRHPFGLTDPRGWELEDEQAEGLYLHLGGKEKKTGAHPLGMALLASVADGLGSDPVSVGQRYPLEFYRKFEEKLFSDLYEQVLTVPQQHMLRLCALYRRPIPDGHADALNLRVEDESAFDTLVQRLLLSPHEQEQEYQLHALFAELTQQRIQGGFELQLDHARIADAWLQQLKGKKRESLPNIRAANEGAHHLLEAEEFSRLQELSANLLGPETPGRLEQISQRLHQHGDDNNYYVLELLVKLDPDNHKAHRFFGETIEHKEGRGSDKALEHYLKAHELLPSFPQYLANIGRCLLDQKGGAERFVALVDDLDDYVREKAVDPYVHDIYSRCLEGMGDGDKASRHRQEQIRLQTRNAAIYNDEAVYLREQRRYAEALKVLKQAERAGVMNDYLWAVKAGVLQDDGQGPAASRLRQALIQAGSKDAAFFADEAAYLRDQGNYPAALEILALAEQRGCTDQVTDTIRHGIEQRVRRGQ